MEPLVLQIQDIARTLKALDPSSAAGADELHPALLKACADQLAYPMLLVFRLSLAEGRLPVLWKSSLVVPIFKKGTKYDPLNYRPISLTSVACKCLERLINRHLTTYLEDNNILTDNQFGFRAGRSTMDQLLIVYNDISLWLDGGHAVDLILFDFSKAFDLVSHPILLRKLQLLGMDPQLLIWIEAFLTSRTMTVSVKDKLSSPRLVGSGVPQSSVLGPTLFLVFVNHIAAHLSCQYKIFADDLKIYLKVSSPNSDNHLQHAQTCQNDINILERTAHSWGLRLNRDKCVVLRFQRNASPAPPPQYHINQTKIRVESSHADLGVLVSSDLKFHQHISNTARKAAGLTQNLLKSTVCRTPKFMMTLFCSHVRPIIEYCSCVWNTGYVGDLRLLESVQRRWTKSVHGLASQDYKSRLRSLDQYSTQGRLLRADLIQCWKIFHGKCSVASEDLFLMAPPTGTRGHRFKVCHTRAQTDVRKRSFSMRVVSTWNSLPDCAVSEIDYRCFKTKLADALGEQLYEFPP